MTKKQRRRGRIWIPVLSVLATAALAAGLMLRSGAFPRLEVSGFRISEEEYLRAMYEARDDVLSDHAAAGISLKDWSRETALGDPVALTVDRALEILSEYYAVSLLAVERGYLADAGYDAMLRDMEAVNEERQSAVDSGGIVTGIPVFSVDDYIAYRTLNISLQFLNDPDNHENTVTEAQLLERYEADRDDLYRQMDSMELRFLLADGADEALEQEFTLLRQKALETGDLSLALEEFSGLKAYFQEVSLTPDTYGTYARALADVVGWSAALQTGELSRVIRAEDRLCLIECVERTASPYTPLEEVRSIVVQSIRESRYDELIEVRMETMEIQGGPEDLYRFTAERLS